MTLQKHISLAKRLCSKHMSAVNTQAVITIEDGCYVIIAYNVYSVLKVRTPEKCIDDLDRAFKRYGVRTFNKRKRNGEPKDISMSLEALELYAKVHDFTTAEELYESLSQFLGNEMTSEDTVDIDRWEDFVPVQPLAALSSYKELQFLSCAAKEKYEDRFNQVLVCDGWLSFTDGKYLVQTKNHGVFDRNVVLPGSACMVAEKLIRFARRHDKEYSVNVFVSAGKLSANVDGLGLTCDVGGYSVKYVCRYYEKPTELTPGKVAGLHVEYENEKNVTVLGGESAYKYLKAARLMMDGEYDSALFEGFSQEEMAIGIERDLCIQFDNVDEHWLIFAKACWPANPSKKAVDALSTEQKEELRAKIKRASAYCDRIDDFERDGRYEIDSDVYSTVAVKFLRVVIDATHIQNITLHHGALQKDGSIPTRLVRFEGRDDRALLMCRIRTAGNNAS